MATKMRTLDMTYIALFAVILAICSWISIPAEVPFTLQTFGVFLTVGVLGGRRGTLAVLVYLLLGAVGIPVFAGFIGGMGKILGSTGGYLIGFLFAALVMWAMEYLMGRKRWVLALSMFIGMLVYYAFGTAWFMIVYANQSGAIGLWTALGLCVFPYILPDIIKIVFALAICKQISTVVKFD